MRLSTRKKFTAVGAALVLALLLSLGFSVSPASAGSFHVDTDSFIKIEASDMLEEIDVILTGGLCELEEHWTCEGWEVLEGAISSVVVLALTYWEWDPILYEWLLRLEDIEIHLLPDCSMFLLDTIHFYYDEEEELWLYNGVVGDFELVGATCLVLEPTIVAELDATLNNDGTWNSLNAIEANFLISWVC